MTKYDRLTVRIGSHTTVSGALCPKSPKNTKRGEFCNDKACKLRITRECPILASFDRLSELEDMIENGELVSKEWHDEQVLHAESEIKRLQSENKTLRLAKDDFKKRFKDSGHRNKKLSLKLGTLKKEIRKAKIKAVEEFAENLEARCFDEEFYMTLHDAIEKELKEYEK